MKKLALDYLAVLVLSVLIFTAIAFLFTGCVGYRHSRTVEITFPDGTKYSKKESTPLVSLFKKGEAGLIHSQTIDNDKGYSRTVGVEHIETSGDPKSIEALGTAGGAIAGGIFGAGNLTDLLHLTATNLPVINPK